MSEDHSRSFRDVREFFAECGITLVADCSAGQWGILVVGGDAKVFLEHLDAMRQESDPGMLFFVSVMTSLIATGGIDLSLQLGRACEWGMSNDQVRLVLDEVNEGYIVPLGIEITSHGLLRSFRFWSEKEKVSYLTEAGRVLELLSERYGDTCLGYGAVLSYVRAGGLSPHDDDLDVLVGLDMGTFATFTDAVTDLAAHLSSNGYEIVGKWPAFLKVTRPGFVGDIDVFVALKEGSTVAAIPGPRGVIPWSSLFPASRGSIHGVSLPLPRMAEDYLRHVYGESWRVPQRGWQHSWNYHHYTDIT